ncbi:MAG: aldehyde dehydrogenase family protein [Chloroflexi bacterium]|nr:aldehyde dehydrogenase family protein [Chloroflexota bacterium]
MLAQEYKNHINGKWVVSRSGKTFSSRNPANGELIGTLQLSDAQDVNDAVDAAQNAFEKWRKYPAPKRAELIYRVSEVLRARKQEMGELLTREMGKVLPEALGDVQEAIDMAMYMAGEGRRLNGMLVPSELPSKWAMAVRDPLGVVAAITPWNFPIAIPAWKMFPALVCGNTVVWKPASDTPVLAERMIEIYEEAGFPPGVVNLITGSGGVVGDCLVAHPKVRLVTFTGSTDIGRAVSIQAAQNLKRVSLEMGGKNAIMVMDDADIDLAIEGIVWSAFGTSGQRCTACSRIIVHEAIKKELVDKLAARVSKLRLGDGLLATTEVGPVINNKAAQKIHEYTEIAKQEGATVLIGGDYATDGELAKGSFYQPTIFDNVLPTMRVAQEEIFGPSLSVISCNSLEQAIEYNNHTNFGLSASLYTSDVNRAFEAMRDVTTGLLYINAGTIGSEVQLPFGGTRGTGNGHREGGGPVVLDTFCEWKTIYVDYSGRLQRAQIDTDTLAGKIK